MVPPACRDLRAGFAAARTPGEDVEDQCSPVQDLRPDELLEVADLRGGQLVVEDKRLDLLLACLLGDLERLPFSNQVGGIEAGPFLEHGPHDHTPRRVRQEGELGEVFLGLRDRLVCQSDAHEKNSLADRCTSRKVREDRSLRRQILHPGERTVKDAASR